MVPPGFTAPSQTRPQGVRALGVGCWVLGHDSLRCKFVQTHNKRAFSQHPTPNTQHPTPKLANGSLPALPYCPQKAGFWNAAPGPFQQVRLYRLPPTRLAGTRRLLTPPFRCLCSFVVSILARFFSGSSFVVGSITRDSVACQDLFPRFAGGLN